ncbi:hypothetical protein V8F20_006252 [Naviculisporaceae sp. PSN 640]
MTTGVFRYLNPTGIPPSVKPWSKVDVDYSSFSRTSRRRSVTNIRTLDPASFSTDTSGFSVHHSPTSLSPGSFSSETEVRSTYYSEISSLLKQFLPDGDKITHVEIFDHTIRKHDPNAARQPVQQVHVDQTPLAAVSRVRRHVLPPSRADNLMKSGRWQLINVWRPISHPASDFPLAVIDWRTTSVQDKSDLVKVDLLYPIANRLHGDNDDRGKEVLPSPESLPSTDGYEVKGETYGIAPRDSHKFYYCKDMTPEEVMFIKCFDSWSQGQELEADLAGGVKGGKEGIAGLTPHTAFVDPDTPKDAKGRESIEVRCLVFYGEDGSASVEA